MKILKNIALFSIMGILWGTSCKKTFLEQPAVGILDETNLSNAQGVEALLVGAYGALDGVGSDGNAALGGGSSWEASPDNWIYGTVAAGEASKGSNATDQPPINAIASFTLDPSIGFFNTKWRATYEGITRTNKVIRIAANAAGLTDAEKNNVIGQARFLRGHFYFELKKMFNMVPWIDETMTDLTKVTNDKDIWPQIEADFKFAYDNLPATQSQVGKVNKWAAAAYLGKSYLYEKKYPEAKTIFDDVIKLGTNSAGVKYALTDRYFDNFSAATKNNSETVFQIQMSANQVPGSINNGNTGGMLNFPYGGDFGCCGFFQPTQYFVNHFRTDAVTGLPSVTNFNANPIKSDMGVLSAQPFTPDAGTVDPRLDWTVGRRGIPYLDWGNHPGASWIRDQTYAGPYSPKKNIYSQANKSKEKDGNSWAPGTSINVNVIRYADVLLMSAEAEAQTGNIAKAMEYVNMVRARAAKAVNMVKKYKDNANPLGGYSDVDAANYKVGAYTLATFGATKEDALKTIYFERTIELGMEGHRFFDLARWGIADTEINAYFAYQKNITLDVRNGKFTKGKNEYYPIPQRQIDLSNNGGTPLKQNPNYN